MVERLEAFVQMNFPQISLHGGDFVIEDVDVTAGTAVINLTSACDGCGLSPMTVQAIHDRAHREFPELRHLEVYTGPPPDEEAEKPELPF